MKLNVGSSFYTYNFVKEMGYNDSCLFDKSALRVCVCVPGDIAFKSFSSTYSSLYNIIRGAYTEDEVFIDFAFNPLYTTQFAYKQSKLPNWYGIISHQELKDFDILLISISVTTTEFFQTYLNLKQIDFPLEHIQRVEDSSYPFVIAGGGAVDSSAILDGVVDMYFLGFGERGIPILIDEALKFNTKLKKNKSSLISILSEFKGFYYPAAYDYSATVDNGIVKHIQDGYNIDFPERVQFDYDLDINKYGNSLDTYRAMSFNFRQRKVQTLMSYGCNGIHNCSFCSQGNQVGIWRERSLKDLDKALETIKKFTMTETFGFYSFNCSYYSRFSEALKLAYQYFDRIASINMRADVLSYCPKYIELLKSLNTIAVSFAVEGFGNRLRNEFYNKDLSFNEIYNLMENVFKIGFLKVKVGYILSGYETQEDFREGFDEITKIMDLKDKMFANTHFQINVTKLVHYAGTKLYDYGRVMAYDSYLACFDKKYYYYPFKELVNKGYTVKVRVNKAEVFLQQLLIDTGKFASKIFFPALDKVKSCRGNLFYDAVKEQLEKHKIDIKKQFLNFDIKHTWNKHIEYRNYEFLKSDKFNKDIKGCVKTVSSIKRGYELGCNGCGQCKEIGKDYSKYITTRQVEEDFSIEDIKSKAVEFAPFVYYMFQVEFTEKARYISKQLLCRKLLSKFNDYVEDFHTNFRFISDAYYTRMDNECYPSNYTGYMAFVACFRNTVDFTPELISKVSKACDGIKLHNVMMTDRYTLKDTYMFIKLEIGSIIFNEEVFKHILDNTKEIKFFSDKYKASSKKVGGLRFWYKIVGNNIYLIFRHYGNPLFLFSEQFPVNKLYKNTKMSILSVVYQYDENCFKDFFSDETVLSLEDYSTVFND